MEHANEVDHRTFYFFAFEGVLLVYFADVLVDLMLMNGCSFISKGFINTIQCLHILIRHLFTILIIDRIISLPLMQHREPFSMPNFLLFEKYLMNQRVVSNIFALYLLHQFIFINGLGFFQKFGNIFQPQGSCHRLLFLEFH